MASWLIVAALLPGASLALSPSASMTQKSAGAAAGEQKKDKYMEVCLNPCAEYDGVAGINEDTDIVCINSDNYCKSASNECDTIGAGFIECRQKAANMCENLCSAWTGTATEDTRNVCQTHVLQDQHNQPRDHYSCHHVPGEGCAAGSNECRQKQLPSCLSECGNMRSNMVEYPYPDGDNGYKGEESSGITQGTKLVCQNNFPTTAQIDWMGYCLKMPCDYHQHNSLGWNGSTPCRQYFNYCENSCAGGSEDPPEVGGEYQMLGDEAIPIMCYDSWSSECMNPLADGTCPQSAKFNKKCGRRLQHQDLSGVQQSSDSWGSSGLMEEAKNAEVKPHSAQQHPLMRQESKA